MADPVVIDIPRGEAWFYDWRVLRRDRYTRDPKPLTSASAVRAWLSATWKGDPILAGSEITLAQGELELREDDRERWTGIQEPDDVTTALSAIATGDSVYEVLDVDGERKSRALVVAD